MTVMANFRRDKIPMWINLLSGVVILILLFKTYACFINPALAYGTIDGNVVANHKVLWELAGRNLAMIAIILIALRSQNAGFMALIMAMNFVRESFDMFMGIKFANGDIKQILAAMSFLIFIIPYVLAIIKLKGLNKSNPEK